ncbi:MAG: hypothetical protein INR62_07520 [Rhodospirillales bacterium]|nr:hypothetical protein [Acetobacter sp.]
MNAKQAAAKVLQERLDRLLSEMERLRERADEVRGLLRIMSEEGPDTGLSEKRKVRRGDLKDIVLSLYKRAAETGLSAAECVKSAQDQHGVALQPASVSSLLSRLKADGVLFYDGERYRLKRYAGPRSAA